MAGKSPPNFDTIVVGAGQAGLTMGYLLAQQGRRFLILDGAKRIGDTWRDRWDSLRLFTSAANSSLPGMPLLNSEDSFPTKDETAEYLEAYAKHHALPVRLGFKVEALTRSGACYTVSSGSDQLTTKSVVVATGPFQHPRTPRFANELDPAIAQLHSSQYRGPDDVPAGGVLVVGAGNSGAEIAVELAEAGRSVWLSGRDTHCIPSRIVNSRAFWCLAEHVLNVDSPWGQEIKRRVLGQGDPRVRLTTAAIRKSGAKRAARAEGAADGKPRLEDGRVLDVDVVIWATGFQPAFTWIDLPGLAYDARGYPVHEKGVVKDVPGLYFLGLPFQRTAVSATIRGIRPDAKFVASQLKAYH